MRKIVFLFLYLSLVAFSAMGQKKIALLEPRVGDGSTGVSGMEKAMVRGELRKAIVNHTGYEAFTRADIDKLMAEQDFQRTGLVSDDQIKEIGIMSGADYICVSTLNKTNTEFYLEAYLVNVESAQISNPASQYGELNGGKLANMLPVCQALAQELLGTISPVVSSIVKESTQKPAESNQPAKEQSNKTIKPQPIEIIQTESHVSSVKINEMVGTIKDFGDGTQGIVFYAENGIGLAFSVDVTEAKWCSAKKKGTKDISRIDNDCDDDRKFQPGRGEDYTRSILAEMGSGEVPAAEWCARHGNGWYLPSAGELVYLFMVRNNPASELLFDRLLRGNDSMLDDGWYWSSSECSRMEAINVSSGGRASGEEKSEIEKTVAVRMFTY